MTITIAPVVVIGDGLIDEIRDDDGVRTFVGGAALNVAVGLTVLGVPATLVCTLGADDEGWSHNSASRRSTAGSNAAAHTR